MRDSLMNKSGKSPSSSLLIKRIRSAISNVTVAHPVLRVSVAKDTNWEKSPSGDEVLVRWLCWSIHDGEDEITPPEFEVVSTQVTSDTLAKELEISVDNEIDV